MPEPDAIDVELRREPQNLSSRNSPKESQIVGLLKGLSAILRQPKQFCGPVTCVQNATGSVMNGDGIQTVLQFVYLRSHCACRTNE